MKKISPEVRAELEELLTVWMRGKGILPDNRVVVVDLRTVPQRVENAHAKINELPGDPDSMMKDSIIILGLSRRAEGVLLQCGFNTIEKLFEQKGGLAKWRGMGKKSFLEVRARLQKFGFKLDEGWRLIHHFGPDDWKPDR